MSVLVAEAIGNEQGKAKGGVPGDQTGKEIVVRKFSPRSYAFTQILRCTDRKIAEAAAGYAVRIADCDRFGYDQEDRWSGARHIESVGSANLEEAQAGSFDCSSLVIECYRLAGLPLKMTGYTGNITKLLLATGVFKEIELSDMEYAEIGDVLTAPGIHTLIVVSDGSKSEDDPEPEPEPVPTGDYVCIIRGAVNVRKTPCVKRGNTILTAHKGDDFPYLGYTEADARGVEWWAVDVAAEHMIGYISSNNTRHAILVSEED